MAAQLTWLVTGCSSGLGEAMARAITAKGDRVIATARGGNGISGAERLSALKEAGAAVLELDVTASQEELNEKAKEAWAIYGHIDVLVNNAGYLEAGLLEELNEELFTNSLRVNVIGPLNLTRALLPFMRERKTGTLLFVGSVSVHYIMPGATSYIGSKSLLEGIVPSLAAELAPFNLRTSLLTFGHFSTDLVSPGHVQFRVPNPVPEYADLNKQLADASAAGSKDWPGHPGKACELVVEAVRGEGRCMGKELPVRLPIGSDTFDIMRGDLNARLKICDEWQDVMSQTNRE